MRYRIESNGSGLTYTITRLADGATLFLQGDAALEFERMTNSTNARYTDDDVCDEYGDQFDDGRTNYDGHADERRRARILDL